MIQEKSKAIVLLTLLVALIGFTNYVEQQNVDQMDRSFSSIYYDRLIPATEIFHITEQLFRDRMLFEQALYRDTHKDNHFLPIDGVIKHQRNIDQHISNFEKTYLVQSEATALSALKASLSEYRSLERKIVALIENGESSAAEGLYETEATSAFQKLFLHLQDLSTIQTKVGLDLVKESKVTISSSNLVLTLQIMTAIVFALLVQALIAASRIIKGKQEDFHLN